MSQKDNAQGFCSGWVFPVDPAYTDTSVLVPYACPVISVLSRFWFSAKLGPRSDANNQRGRGFIDERGGPRGCGRGVPSVGCRMMLQLGASFVRRASRIVAGSTDAAPHVVQDGTYIFSSKQPRKGAAHRLRGFLFWKGVVLHRLECFGCPLFLYL